VLLAELTNAADLLLRDRLRRAAAAAPSLLPRLPFGLSAALPPLPAPLLPVPGRGFLPAQQLVDELAPALSQSEEVYLQTIVELAAGLLGVQPADLEAPDARLLQQLLFNPNEQVRELQAALSILAGGGSSNGTSSSSSSSSSGADPAVVREMSAQVVDALMSRAAQRLSVDPDTLFPMRRSLLGLVLAQQPAPQQVEEEPPSMTFMI
jgi:hypothetical protein